MAREEGYHDNAQTSLTQEWGKSGEKLKTESKLPPSPKLTKMTLTKLSELADMKLSPATSGKASQ